MMDQIRMANDPNAFREQVLDSDRPVIVNFYSQWCPDSRDLAPTFEQLAEEYEGRVDFVRVDVDAAEAVEIERRYNIRKTPTVKLFVDGKDVETWELQADKTVYRQPLDSLLNKRAA